MRRLPMSLMLSATLCLAGCHGTASDHGHDQHRLPDTLRVATLYSPTSYFLYRDMPMGYDYSLLESLVKEKGMALDLNIASSLADAVDMLQRGDVDLLAYEVPVTSEYKEAVLHCGPENVTTQVLVQPAGRQRITDVTQLVGREVYVESGTKYQQRIENLNNELGGGILIHPVERDTLITEDMIAMVSSGEIPLTVVDSDIARINKTYYPDLDITMPISFPQRSAWAVNKDNGWLADSIDVWIKSDRPRRENDQLLKRYFELSKLPPTQSMGRLDFKGGRVSPYDAIFRSYGHDNNIDWRLLAAIAYAESGFSNDAVSWAGARGIMQIMPRVARGYGIDPDALVDPDVSVSLATRIFKDLDKSLTGRIPDSHERMKFILASYNAGLGHIYDAIEIARNTGRDPSVWYGNVAEALALKAKPEYYNQPYCKNGYLRAGQTIQYVDKVMDLYSTISQNAKL